MKEKKDKLTLKNSVKQTKNVNNNNNNNKRKSHNQKIYDAFRLRTQEKEAAKEAQQARQEAVNVAMDRYKSNKRLRLKKLARRTRRGQPVMQGQIELLLDKIQEQKEKNKQE